MAIADTKEKPVKFDEETLAELGQKLGSGFESVTERLETHYGQDVDRIEVNDREYSDNKITVDATFYLEEDKRDVRLHASPTQHKIEYGTNR